MNILALVLQEAEAAPGIFDINTGVSFWTLVIFLILLLVLSKFAWRPILGALEARERRIQEVLDAAARDREESARLFEEQRRLLAEARAQAQQIMAEGRQAAERVQQDLLAKAREEHEAILARATQEIQRERERAVAELRAEAVELSLAAAAKLLERRLGSEEDRRLVREYLEKVGVGDGVGEAR